MIAIIVATMMIMPLRAHADPVAADADIDIRLRETDGIGARCVRRLRDGRHGEKRSRNGRESKRLHFRISSWTVGAEVTHAMRIRSG
jgi:hypothetical protein